MYFGWISRYRGRCLEQRLVEKCLDRAARSLKCLSLPAVFCKQHVDCTNVQGFSELLITTGTWPPGLLSRCAAALNYNSLPACRPAVRLVIDMILECMQTRFQSALKFHQMFRTRFVYRTYRMKGAPMTLAIAETP